MADSRKICNALPHNFCAVFANVMLAVGVLPSAAEELKRFAKHPGALHSAEYLVAVLFKVRRHSAKPRLVEQAIGRTSRDALNDMWPMLRDRKPQLAGDRRRLGLAEFLVTFATTAQFFELAVRLELPIKGAVLAAVRAQHLLGLRAALGKVGTTGLPYDDDWGGPGSPRTTYGGELDAALCVVSALEVCHASEKVKKTAEAMATLLMEADADPNAATPDGTTAFMRAVAAKNVGVAHAIAGKNYTGTTTVRTTGQTLYHLAGARDSDDECRQLIRLATLIDPGGINRVDHHGQTALVAYIESGGSNGSIRALLDAKADPAWFLHTSPLEAALQRTAHERTALIRTLLLAGAPREDADGNDLIDRSEDAAIIGATAALRGHPLVRCSAVEPSGDAAAVLAYVRRRGVSGILAKWPAGVEPHRLVRAALRPWAPARHVYASAQHRRTVETVLLVARRLRCSLPKEMWLEILGFTVHDAAAIDAVSPGQPQLEAMALLRRGRAAWRSETARGLTARGLTLRDTRTGLANALLTTPEIGGVEAYLDDLTTECVERVRAFGRRQSTISDDAAAITAEFEAHGDWGSVGTVAERLTLCRPRSRVVPYPTLAYVRMRRAADEACAALCDIPGSLDRATKLKRL